MSLCKECGTGVTHEGEPSGENNGLNWSKEADGFIEGAVEEINGVQTYVAIPPAGKEYDKTKAVLYLTDLFGIQLVNNRLLVDDFAKHGFQTYMPDILNGDPAKMDGSFNREQWFAKHGQEQTRPPIDKVITALQARGIKEFAATGYCFGARYVFDLAFDGVIKVSAVSHPSLLGVPQDLEKFKATGVPLLINSCEHDKPYPPESQKIGDDILGGGGKVAEKYKRAYFEGVGHGFAVRGDLSDPKLKEAKEQAFFNIVEWFRKHL